MFSFFHITYLSSNFGSDDALSLHPRPRLSCRLRCVPDTYPSSLRLKRRSLKPALSMLN